VLHAINALPLLLAPPARGQGTAMFAYVYVPSPNAQHNECTTQIAVGLATGGVRPVLMYSSC